MKARAIPKALGTVVLTLFLAACQQDGASSGAASAPASAASPSMAAGSAFDGTYRGAFRLTRDSGRCGPVATLRTMTVVGGQARIRFETEGGHSATGSVRGDGRFELAGRGGNLIIRIEGRIDGGRAIGTMDSRACAYAFQLLRAS